MWRWILLMALGFCIFSCSGNGAGSDGGQEDGQEAGSDLKPEGEAGESQGEEISSWGSCPFPYQAPAAHIVKDELGQEFSVKEVQVRCQLRFEDLDAEILLMAEPTEMRYESANYKAFATYFCSDGTVQALLENASFFSTNRHGWKHIEIAQGDRHYIYGYSETCVGARPCTPFPDQFDVKRLSDGVLIAEKQPTICAGVGETGVPMPLVPQVRVPPNPFDQNVSFSMGSGEGDPDESPVHTVEFRAVRMDVREATNEDFTFFLNDQGNLCPGQPCVDLQGAGSKIELRGDRFWPVAGSEELPIVQVSWIGADAYCRWRHMRLLAECEWEAAATALGERRYPWGDEEPTCDYSVYDACAADGPASVCGHVAGVSREGICDLSGNVAEWVNDFYQADFYSTCGLQCGDGPFIDTGLRVVRGGSFARPSHNLRGTDRDSAAPTAMEKDLGFRCVSNNPSF